MNQAEVKKHIKTGTPLAVTGGVSMTPSRARGEFSSASMYASGSVWPQTRVVPLGMQRMEVTTGRGWRASTKEVPVVLVRLDDGTEGRVKPSSIAGTWAEYEAAKERREAEEVVESNRADRTRDLAKLLGGSSWVSHGIHEIHLSIKEAEALADRLADSPEQNGEAE